MAVPGIPANFYVQQGNGQVFLSWDITATALGYSVERSPDGVTFTVVATPATNLYLDTTVTVGTLYYYKVAATNGSGTGTYTAAQSIVPTLTGQMSLGQVRLLAQQEADRVNSNFVTLPEWNTYINQSYFELYDILVQKYGDEYYLAPPWQFITTNSQFYNLPDGSAAYVTTPGGNIVCKPFYKLKGIDLGLQPNNSAWVTLQKFNFIARNRYVFPNLTTSFLGVVNLRYRIMGSQIEFIPPPQAGQFLQVWYVPRMTQLLADTDIMDGVSGWTEYVVVDAAIKVLMKEESDTTMLMQRKMGLLQRIEEAAENRDASLPDTISDSRRYTDPYGTGSPNGDGPFGGY